MCTFCEQNTQSLIHLFWDCDFVQTFRQNIQYWLIQHQIIPQDFSLTLPTCLGLVNSTEDILLHHARVIGKYHIYLSKTKKTILNLQVFFHKHSLSAKKSKSVMLIRQTLAALFVVFLCVTITDVGGNVSIVS